MKSSIEAEEIQHHMQQVRANLGVEVRDLVINARAMTDWRHYWRGHPGLCSAGAALLGFLLVPAKRVAPSDMKRMTEAVRSHIQPPVNRPPSGLAKRLMGELAGLALGFAVKHGMQIVEDRFMNTDKPGQDVAPEPSAVPKAKPRRRSP